ncbi:MAG: MBL fold metallo-hydrolase [Nitrososphaera sp.]|jgi:L-ascorbate metabolism protein UlaG (beta-lactamase superfamily)
MLEYKGIRFDWLGHDGFKITANGRIIIYIDPYQLQSGKNDADIVLISHNHFDHLSMDDLKKVVSPSRKTVVVAAKECVEQLKPLGLEVKPVRPGDRLQALGVPVEAVRAYNTNKTFHPKADDKVGFVLTLNDMRIYHTGDTDDIPEFSEVKPDIALVPVSGTYVMTADEAAKAVNERIKPKMLAIPMHYASIVGSEKDAERFKDLVKVCPVEILQRS